MEPRGVVPILFGLLVLEESGIAMRDEILIVVITTVLLGVFAFSGLRGRTSAALCAHRCWVSCAVGGAFSIATGRPTA